MADYEALEAKVQELAIRVWDVPAIEARCKRLVREGIRTKTLDREEILANRQQILDRVERRGQEYNYIARNCARSTALAVMEQFGLGNAVCQELSQCCVPQFQQLLCPWQVCRCPLPAQGTERGFRYGSGHRLYMYDLRIVRRKLQDLPLQPGAPRDGARTQVQVGRGGAGA